MAKIKLKNRKALVVYNKTDFDKNKHFAQANTLKMWNWSLTVRAELIF